MKHVTLNDETHKLELYSTLTSHGNKIGIKLLKTKKELHPKRSILISQVYIKKKEQ